MITTFSFILTWLLSTVLGIILGASLTFNQVQKIVIYTLKLDKKERDKENDD